MPLAILLSTTTVQLAGTRSVSDEDVRSITTIVEEGVTTSSCTTSTSTEPVTLRIVGAPTRVRVVLHNAATSTVIDLTRNEPWRDALERGVGALLFAQADCPEESPVSHVPSATTRLDLVPHEPTRPKTRVLPWVLVGSAAAFTVTGAVFGIRARSFRNDAEKVRSDEEFDRLRDATFVNGLAANVLFTAAGTAAIVAIGLWVFD